MKPNNIVILIAVLLIASTLIWISQSEIEATRQCSR